MKRILSLILVLIITISLFAACADKPETNPEKSAQSQELQENAVSSDKEGGKYSKVEVYENDKGNKAAKTESGEEVELSGENFADLYAQYEKVKGSGSEKEKELLDKIQVILEAPRN